MGSGGCWSQWPGRGVKPDVETSTGTMVTSTILGDGERDPELGTRDPELGGRDPELGSRDQELGSGTTPLRET